MPASFVHDVPAQRVVFAPGAANRLGEEVARLAWRRAFVIATAGSGARLGARIVALLGGVAAGLHAEAVIHVPRAVADAGLAAAKRAAADGLVAVGGGSAIGLAKAIALATDLPIIALPTTFSGSEATPIYGTTEGERKLTGRDWRVLPKVVIYDSDLSAGLPSAAAAASGMNAIAHCVEGLWIAERTPVTVALASKALRLFSAHLPRAVTHGDDRDARGQCLIAAWLAGTVLTAGTGLHHKLAHVLGGLGLPHAETHAVILPHVTRFNLAEAPEAHERLASLLSTDDPAAALASLLQRFPIPQRLRDVGFERGKIIDVAQQVATLGITHPRPATAEAIEMLLTEAY